MVRVCFLGSSTGWAPGLITDMMCIIEDDMEINFYDLEPKNIDLCIEWCNAANKHHGRKDKFVKHTEIDKALKDVDAVIITISTGGLDAMEHDISIPEKYGIYATVGDTTGPGGWSRAVRNIPVFKNFAKHIKQNCPDALVLNYTNPLAALTSTLIQQCPNPVVGLCHAYFETKDVIQKVFELEDWSKISISIAGMNHFTWVVDFKIGKDDGYQLLREKTKNQSILEYLPKYSFDEIGISSGHELCAVLYDTFGYLPYPADRHSSEFLSFVLAGRENYPKLHDITFEGQEFEATCYCNVRRTTIEQRRKGFPDREKNIQGWVDGSKEMPQKSRETSAEMLNAFVNNKPMIDSVNTINVGQIPALPLGACVETLGCVDGLGIRPLFVGNVPDFLAELMRPHANCQKWITEGTLTGNRKMLLQALYHDPICSHLNPHEIRTMANELFEANKKWLSDTNLV